VEIAREIIPLLSLKLRSSRQESLHQACDRRGDSPAVEQARFELFGDPYVRREIKRLIQTTSGGPRCLNKEPTTLTQTGLNR
jgi:hypothetical protein